MSPGRYQEFWRNKILPNFDREQLSSSSVLKPYRELWLGSIIAAAYTAGTGRKWFVGLGLSDPPDFILASTEAAESPSGRKGINLRQIGFEATWCDLSRGDTLLGHISLKNKPSYVGMEVLVYLTDSGVRAVDIAGVRDHLRKQRVYPDNIHVLLSLASLPGRPLLPGTFQLFSLKAPYMERILNLTDSSFHRDNAIYDAGRGFRTEGVPMAVVDLQTPSLDRPDHSSHNK